MDLFKDVEHKIIKDFDKNFNFTGIEYDSRKIKENNIFVAMEGFSVDGHNYIESAVKKGAKLIILEKEQENYFENISYVIVKNLRKHLGQIASNFYDYPQNKLKIIGITGTNGKTTSTFLMEHILGRVARIGTIEYKIGDEIFEAPNTTPESLDLIKICDMAVKKSIDYLVMEVSSHALEMGRVDMLEFDSAIFTNLSQDHLDYHKNMENYFNAKSKLFQKLKDKKNISVNIDDEYGKKIFEKYKDSISYSLNYGILKGEVEKFYLDGMDIKINYKDKEFKFKTELAGKFNLYNILGVIGGALNLGFDIEFIIEKIKTSPHVPGRFQTVNLGQDFMLVVDYAHTDDGLINILSSLEEIEHNKIISVFGAGGDRDKTKRPKMAKACAKYSDYVIATSDNPRTENPKEILKDIEDGFIEVNYKDYEVIEDRESAIKKAVQIAQKNDIILVAGKGHENYQIIGKEKRHFDDREIAEKYIKIRMNF